MKDKLAELLEKSSHIEHPFQEFFEKNPLVFPKPFLQNHGLHMESIITKFPLDTSLKTDFVYLSKSSVNWNITLVEIEPPGIPLFTKNDRPSSKFTAALSQIDDWRNFISRSKSEVVRRLHPLMFPWDKLQIDFYYLLIIGRGSEYKNSLKRKDRFFSLQQPNFKIYTYDSIMNQSKFSQKANILKLTKQKFAFKYMHFPPKFFFSTINSENFELAPEFKRSLMENGYEIDSWEKGKLLSFNGVRAEVGDSFFQPENSKIT